MKIISPTWALIKPTNQADGVTQLRFIEQLARISHRAEDKQTLDSWERFIPAVVLNHGDWSVTEHSTATVIFRVNRGITHEMVRHRLFGYTQESTRFVNYGKGQDETSAEYIPSERVADEHRMEWEHDLAVADATYLKWLKRGYTPQVARDHLPNALAATIAVSANFRSWRWVLLSRTTKESHPDMRHVMIPLLAEFKARIPFLFEDIVPEERQIDAFRKPH